MSKRKKITIWVMGVIGALLVLLLILMLLLPRVINLEPIKQKIIARISQEVGGELEFQRIDLSFLPRPRVIIHQGSLSIPGKVAGTLEALKVYPRILPLLRGRIRIAMLRVEAPQFKMALPKTPRKKEEKRGAFSLATIQEAVAPVLGVMAVKAPGLTLVVDGGNFDLTEGNRSVFSFQDIHGRIGLPPDKLEIDLACISNLWESIALEGRLDPESFEGGGRIQARDFKPQVLMDNLFPLATRRVGESRVNLDMSFRMDGLQVLEGEVEGSFPLLTMQQANEKLVIRGKSLRGTFHVDEESITVSLTELDLDHPRLKMSGKLFMDRAIPRVRVDLEGREMDLNSIREGALVLAGEIPNVREVLSIVKGGRVPLAILSTQGSSLSDLGNLENILIKGSIREGNIYVPELDLDLKEVKGEAVISKGVLEGRNLEAKFGNTSGREGILKLSLEADDAPFYLDAKLQVDLAQLPSVLRRFTKDRSFLKEITLIEYLRGTATGRLVLSGSIESIKTKVDISDGNLLVRHGRLPYPLEIAQGEFFYDEDNIGVKNLSGFFGKSSFSEVTAHLTLQKERYLEILSGKSLISLTEVFPWLLKMVEGTRDMLKDLKSAHGTVAISALEVKGPLSEPKKWSFRMKGEVKNLTVESTLFSGPAGMSQGRFELVPERVSFTDVQIGVLDASLRGSGSIHGYLEGLQKVDFSLQGNVGPKAVQWASNLMDIPPKLRVRSPLSISRAQGAWKNDGRVSFAADIGVKNGPNVSIDMLLNPEELTIEKLLIQDKESRASLALRLKERELHFDFDGHLDKTTLDNLLTKNEILTGRVDGDFEAHILMDNPMRSTALGKLRVVGLNYPLELKIPLRIEDVSLVAKKNKLTVESALLTWGDSPLSLKGNMNFPENGFLFDMDLSADGLEWEKIKGILQEENQKSGSQGHEDFWAKAIEGRLGIKLGYFKYGSLTWRPLKAIVSFYHGRVELVVNEANLCSISTTGTVKVSPGEVKFHVDPLAGNQELDSALACLLDMKGFINGNFDLEGRLTGRGLTEELTRSLEGNFEFLARDGRVYRFKLLSRIFGLLSTTEILRGKIPDLGKEGFAFSSIRAKGALKGGKLLIQEGIMDGSSLDMVWQGDIDLIDEKVDLTVLVAPLKTVDFVVKKIPLVRDILEGTLVSIPVRVRGDLANPTVTPLSASAVGSELIGIMQRTFRLPLKVIQPLRPGK